MNMNCHTILGQNSNT